VTKIVFLVFINLVTPKARAKHEHLFNEPACLKLNPTPMNNAELNSFLNPEKCFSNKSCAERSQGTNSSLTLPYRGMFPRPPWWLSGLDERLSAVGRSISGVNAIQLLLASSLKLRGPYLGNCDKFNFTFKFEVWMWVRIYQIFERDQIPICHISNKSNPKTDKPKDFQIRLKLRGPYSQPFIFSVTHEWTR
jgi:hypothetical protein